MANVSMFRGGTADFKGWMCDGQYPEYLPPFDAPNYDDTPPFDSHADGAQGAGYLNLWFPLVPRLAETRAHVWQQNALKNLANVNDKIRLAWVPLRSYIDTLYVEVKKFDPALDGVYVKPIAERVTWNFTTKEWDWVADPDFTTVFADALTQQLGLGTPQAGELPYIQCSFPRAANAMPVGFGHNIVARDAQGKPTGGIDNYFGAVVLGLEVVQGTPAQIAELYNSNFALYYTAKTLHFEAPTQIG